MKYQTPEMTVLMLQNADVLTASLNVTEGNGVVPSDNIGYNDDIWF